MVKRVWTVVLLLALALISSSSSNANGLQEVTMEFARDNKVVKSKNFEGLPSMVWMIYNRIKPEDYKRQFFSNVGSAGYTALFAGFLLDMDDEEIADMIKSADRHFLEDGIRQISKEKGMIFYLLNSIEQDKVRYNIYFAKVNDAYIATIDDPKKPVFGGELKGKYFSIKDFKYLPNKQGVKQRMAVLEEIKL